MPPATLHLRLENVCFRFEREPVLEDIQLAIHPGDFIGLIGPNGGGKSTLLKIILGLYTPTSGRVTTDVGSLRQARRHIGYVPQSTQFDRLFPVRVRDVVAMGRLAPGLLSRRPRPDDRRAVADALEAVDLTPRADALFADLSGGQKQRVLIARALATDPRLLLLDEPTASVDPEARGRIYDLLRKLNEHISILLVTHDMGVISSYVKSIGCLNRTLHYHGEPRLTPRMLEETYHCPIDLIAHGVPHRVLAEHPPAG